MPIQAQSLYEQFKDKLYDLHGQCLDTMKAHGAKPWEYNVWMVRGKIVIVLDMKEHGYDVFIPATEDNSIDAATTALMAYLNGEASNV